MGQSISSSEPESIDSLDMSGVINSYPVAAHEAMDILLIMDEIFAHLDLHDLKNCRLVSHFWKQFASKKILKTNCVRISLYCHRVNWNWRPADTEFHRHFRKNCMGLLDMTRSLRDLNECAGDDFPCADYEFVGGNLSAADVATFFARQGSRIKNLKLDGIYNGDVKQETTEEEASEGHTQARYHKCQLTSAERIRELLHQWAPNVESLTLSNFKFKWAGAKIQQDHNFTSKYDTLFLPALKNYDSQSWTHGDQLDPLSSTLYQVLMGAPNLTQLSQFKVVQIDAVLLAEKIHLIKNYDLESSAISDGSLDHLRKFAEARPKLRQFCVKPALNLDTPGSLLLAHECNKILAASQNSLEDLEIVSFTCGRFLPNLKFEKGGFPVLQNLKLTHTTPAQNQEDPGQWAWGEENMPLFSNVFNFNQNFPSLTKFSVQIYAEVDSWAKYFPEPLVTSTNGKLERVSNLEILAPQNDTSLGASLYFEGSQKCWLENLIILCPSVKNLKLVGFSVMDLSEFVLHLFSKSWPQLESLSVAFRKGQDLVCVDTILMMTRECFRGLKKLQIFIEDVQKWAHMDPNPVLLTSACNQFVLNEMPDLKVTFVFDQALTGGRVAYSTLLRQALLVTCPFVNVVHGRFPCSCYNCVHHSSFVFNLNPRLQRLGFFM